MNTLLNIQAFLKPAGLHHGWVAVAAIAISLLWSDGVIIAYCAGTWFLSKEVFESRSREKTYNPLVIAKNIEWMDFVTVWAIAIGYIIWRTM